MIAIGGGAAALIGGGAYAVTQFFGKGTHPDGAADAEATAGDSTPPAYVDQNQSLMNGDAGLAIRKNTPTTGSSFGTPADAAKNAVVKADTVLPKKDPVRHLASRLTFGPNTKVIGDINHLAAASAVKADGNFSQQTHAGVLAVQKFFRLTEDGICGPATWGALVAGQR